ncbi:MULTISPECIES: ABC transporter permease [Brevibacillus]|jgi:peptide/nickel transport system permease protein|uniref:Oligopeptide ABC transporter permease n=1 Tax=Brevibacillus borstelensis AK1 TaxID=1300222 RepID=M8DWZ5_9BACL|nr:ABC transporter permease [Brevibacillus borstelensis]EMT51531.1 oligopeptide ABC transporter permease [Brevibacillus borstelensis AK1]KKX56527.1 peptide ABC transporter permease [Brevibacillus borstelensis cifa_chp40]MBE5395338.1 ABC transporter permease [Brevibacillus borstelensis]MCC0562791.1 ABC transporter permease [Brevibacillus borstelensis]MCM3468744.1 ABC transporter permease [Brevibacillus borstelensis]
MSLPLESQTAQAGSVGQAVKKPGQLRRLARMLLKSKTGTIGLLIVIVVVFMAVFASAIAPHDPAKTQAAQRLKPPMWMEGGSPANPLGTDNLGRDVLSRIIYGSQVSLMVGVCAVAVAGAIGVVLGLVSGYFGGIVDNLIMRTVDSFLAIPNILFMLVILTVLGPSLTTLILVLGFTNWVKYARIIRGEVLSVKERDFVRAARTVGASDGRIIFTHILPNVISSFIVVSTLSVATTIIAEASLSFLGLGIQPPTVSWGGMLSDGRQYLATSWWVATFPGVAITITVLGIMFLGDWLRDILDPRMKARAK